MICSYMDASLVGKRLGVLMLHRLGCSLISGLLMQVCVLLALMGFAERILIFGASFSLQSKCRSVLSRSNL